MILVYKRVVSMLLLWGILQVYPHCQGVTFVTVVAIYIITSFELHNIQA